MDVSEYQQSFRFQRCLQWKLLQKEHKGASGPKGQESLEVQGKFVLSADGLFPSEMSLCRRGACNVHGGRWPTVVLLATFHC